MCVSLPPCICFGNLSKTFKKLHFPLIFNFLLIFRKVLLSPIRNSCTLHVCKQSKFGETKTIVVQKHPDVDYSNIDFERVIIGIVKMRSTHM